MSLALAIVTGVPSALLLVFALVGILSYFVFMPSVSEDGHVFARVHGPRLVNPLFSAATGCLLATAIMAGSRLVWLLWCFLAAVHLVHAVLTLRSAHDDQPAFPGGENPPGLLSSMLDLMVGGELVALAAGARSLPAWKLSSLPEETWIVDVRSKPEFHWNRLSASESYPWGRGLAEAAAQRCRDDPVLVTCFSGHRSPAVAVMLRRMGFKTVYNLKWGILYLLLLERGKKSDGPFALTRPHRDANRRGEDLKWATRAYIALLLVTLVGVPIERVLSPGEIGAWHALPGAVLCVAGFVMVVLSYRGLGRNFRFYAAPRRSGALVTDGIYGYIRHPMYAGVIVGLGGYILLFGSLIFIPCWLGLLILYVFKAGCEERILAEKFPQYLQYRSKTWRFVPYIH